MTRFAWLLAVVALVGCADGEAPEDPVDAFCADAPVVTWDNFGAGFVTQNCQGCHSSQSLDRNDAPEDVFFDERDDVLARRYQILDQATGDEPAMPPSGGVDDEDRELLEIWLTCWAELEEGS